MQKIAVFPGSFDPVTIGHELVVNRALSLFDKIIVAVAENTNKNKLFTEEQKIEMLKLTFKNESKVEVLPFQGLTVEFCKKHNANFILRGIRSNADFEYEKIMAQMNHLMEEKIETVLLFTSLNTAPINSTIVREIILNNGDIKWFVPSGVEKLISKFLSETNTRTSN